MVWYFNFCSPSLPNDPIIELNRLLQAGAILLMMMLSSIVVSYYKLKMPRSSDQDETQSKSTIIEYTGNSDNLSDDKNSDEDDKSVSIAGGFGADENSSYVTFTSHKKKKSTTAIVIKKPEVKNENLKSIQKNFPLVVGHITIIGAFSAMYSPYTEQTLAIVLYILFSFLLLTVHMKKLVKTTRAVWAVMCIILSFVLMSAMLEVAQANYNKGQGECFSMHYKSLY